MVDVVTDIKKPARGVGREAVHRRGGVIGIVVGLLVVWSGVASVKGQGAARPEPPVPLSPGMIAEFDQRHHSVGVTTLVMANGVLVHHRAMGSGQNEQPRAVVGAANEGRIVVSIRVAGGEVEETGENRGTTDAAIVAWERLSVRSIRRDDLVAFLEIGSAKVSSMVTSDAVLLRIEGDLAGVERGLRVARLLLTEPVVNEEDFEAWRERVRSRREAMAAGVGAWGVGGGGVGRRAIFETVTDVMFVKEDARPRRMDDAALERLTASDAQGWIDRMLGIKPGTTAHPIEASIVGDVSIDEASRLSGLYLGTLPTRAVLSAATFAEARRGVRSKEPMEAVRTIAGMKDRAYIVCGFLGADLSDIRDYRALVVAAEVIGGRIKQWPADERGDGRQDGNERRGGGAGVQAIPGGAFPGFGLVLGVSEVPAHRAKELLEKMSGVFESVRERGPSEDEIEEVTARLANSARDSLTRTDYWSMILSSSVYHGLRLDEIAAAESHYAGTTASDVRAVLGKYDTAERRVRVRLMPGAKAE